MKKFFLTAACLVMTNAVAWGQTVGDYRSAASGAWNSVGTWERFDGTSWVAATATPTNADGVITIRNTHTVTITATVTYDQVVVEAGGQVTVSAGFTHTLANGLGTDLVISGTWLNSGGTWTRATGATWSVTSGGTFIHNTTAGIADPLDGATLHAASNFVYRGSSTLTPAISISGRTYGNLTFESSSGSWTGSSTSGTGTWAVNGNLTIGSGVTYNTGGFAGAISVAGNTTIDGAWGTGTVTGANMGAHTFSGNFTVNGTYNLATTGTTQGNITIKGNIYHNGTFTTPSNRAVILSGTSAQLIAGSKSTTFNQNLTIDNAAGVVLGSNVTVNGTLTLTSGNITTTSSNLLTLGPAASVSGGSASSFVNGPMAHTGTGTKTFPIGKGSAYRPVTIVVSGTSPVIQAEVFNAAPGGTPGTGLNLLSSVRYWKIDLNSGTFTSGTVNITYGLDDGVTDPTYLRLARSATLTGTYDNIGGTGSGAPSGNITSDPISSLNYFTLANATGGGNPLPIQLASFAASVIRDNDVEITWRTISESNNYGFEIERMRSRYSVASSRYANPSSLLENPEWVSEGSPWRKIAFVAGRGTTLEPESYSYIDLNVPFGKYYYRIKQIDLDGTSEIFPEMEVTVGVTPDKLILAQNYPNPFNPSTVIEFVVPASGFAMLKVYNVLGQEVATLFEGNAYGGRIYAARFDASNLPSGMYFYMLGSAGKVETRRMMLVK